MTNQVTLRRVRVQWTGPLTLEEARTQFHGDDDYGLYQIHGHHLVYGPNVLLYIGKAVQQSFSKRFAQHDFWTSKENNTRVYLGRLHDEDYQDEGDSSYADWSHLVNEIERLLIYYHSPAYNSQHIAKYIPGPSGLLVQNLGSPGSVVPELTNSWPEGPRRIEEDQ